MRWWPRSIRWQMLLGLLLLEALSINLFAFLLIRVQQNDLQERVRHRLAHEAVSLATQVQEAFNQQRPDWANSSVLIMGEAPSVACARITDAAGKTLFVSRLKPADPELEPEEKAQIPLINGDTPRIFTFGSGNWESVKAVSQNGKLRGYVWIESDHTWDSEQMLGMLRGTVLFGLVWILASILLVWIISRSISRPLAILHRGTRALMSLPDNTGSFPLPVTVDNEIGELIEAFNRMVASIEEQRSGLNDTLSLLDSTLANAPVGLAFFDPELRSVRVNHVFAELVGIEASRILGRKLLEVVPQPIAGQIEQALHSVFDLQQPVAEMELSGVGQKPMSGWTWLASAYPVRTSRSEVRWAGLIVRDVTQRVQSEEALRKTEKLAATGRLAASIAHEINNPLEAITNILFLLRNFTELNEVAHNYVTMAEHEARRIAEIAQQTLRFYRQSTLPARANMAELIDSVLDLYRGRLHTLNLRVERDYDPTVTLFCFSGEIRQVLANFVGNAADASSAGGRLVVRARPSCNWNSPDTRGIRFTIADTGSGMSPEVRQRIFEAFFTTKEVTGTGLGLWVSHEIILKHRGMVRLRSRAAAASHQSGTVFQIFIPDDESLTNPLRTPAA